MEKIYSEFGLTMVAALNNFSRKESAGDAVHQVEKIRVSEKNNTPFWAAMLVIKGPASKTLQITE